MMKRITVSNLIEFSGVKNALALDISKTGTGYVQVVNGVVSHGVFSVDVPRDAEYYGYKMHKAMLVELTKRFSIEGSYDLIVVEDIYGGINVLSFKDLMYLSVAIEELVVEGTFELGGSFYRLNNKSWKADIYRLVKHLDMKGLKDKVKIQKTLIELGMADVIPLDVEQDVYDALGLLVAGMLSYMVKDETPTYRQRVSFNYTTHTSLEIALADVPPRKQDKLKVIDNVESSKIFLNEDVLKEFFISNEDVDVLLLTVDSYGLFGVRNNLYKPLGVSYLTVTCKRTKIKVN